MADDHPRELLLLRHGKSDWDAGVAEDFHRPLAERGRRDAPRMGVWIRTEGIVPDLVVSSTATRAAETARLALEAMEADPGILRWDGRLYGASILALLSTLGESPDAPRRVLLVGHMPGLEDLARHLAGETVVDHPRGKFLPTAALIRLGMPRDWSHLPPGCGVFDSVVRPADLR